MSIYYDEEGDYLEISIEGSSPTYGEDIGEDYEVVVSGGYAYLVHYWSDGKWINVSNKVQLK